MQRNASFPKAAKPRLPLLSLYALHLAALVTAALSIGTMLTGGAACEDRP